MRADKFENNEFQKLVLLGVILLNVIALFVIRESECDSLEPMKDVVAKLEVVKPHKKIL